MKIEYPEIMIWPLRRFCFLMLGLMTPILCQQAYAGSYAIMTTPIPPTMSIGHMLLLTDGRVLVNANGTNIMAYLTPDSHGHYIDATWNTNCPPMNESRLYYASQVLQDGRVFIAGGEYNNSGSGTNLAFGYPGGGWAEILDPQANGGNGAWTSINPPASVLSANRIFGDAESILLPNGNVLIAQLQAFNAAYSTNLVYNPAANDWSLAGTSYASLDETSWVKLGDDSILTIGATLITGPGALDLQTNSYRYIPSSDAWIQDANVPVDLWNSNGEMGAAVLLTNGSAMFFGGSGLTAIYTPSPLGGTNVGSWASSVTMPQGRIMADGPACTLPNGKILLTLEPATNDSPYFVYEFDPDTLSFNLLATNPTGAISDGTSMLQLPDGTVLFDDGQYFLVYQPDPPPLAFGKPTIQTVSFNSDSSLHLTGRLFNGISQGATYGDDQQQESNYPLVRFTDGSSNVYYGRTYNWSSTGVQTGSKIVTTECALPASVQDNRGTYSLQVVANGIASDPVTFYGPVWVDFNYSTNSPQMGTYSQPYSTLAQGVSAVLSGGTISIKPGQSAETLMIGKRMTIAAVGGTATVGD